ncbi:MAG: hypothetical protein DRJ42_09620 [Deltaproteobacteria bacterium]|nr:MAG: hypothetical protein DRJ42_09620 [Deltaproteobacteria bacterium]
MVATRGLTGLRPSPADVGRVTTPPYDVIKEGSPLEALLRGEPASFFHVILGDDPKAALERLVADGHLVADDEPAYYVYEQRWGDQSRTGVFVAGAVTPYEAKEVVRHEKTFDDKVKGRIALANETGYTVGPVFVLTKAHLGSLFDEAKAGDALYEIESDFGGHGDLHGVTSRVFRVPEASDLGSRLKASLAGDRFYIADGHHRYHAALRNEQTHFLCYVTEEARILAYNRVVKGVESFASIKDSLDLEPADEFATPEKHAFCLYSRDGAFTLRAREVPDDVVGRLDCAILERELYPALGLTHSMIADPAHFDYYPESALAQMKARVDAGDYDLAIALPPVSIEELMAVAEAGLDDSDIVMPEKSTFFAPKILSGLFTYRHEKRQS